MAQVDFYNMLSGLGDTIAAKRKESARRQAFEDISDPNGSVDFQKAILGLARAGDLEGAARMSQLALAKEDRSFRREEALRSQSNADRSFGLQVKQAEEKPQYQVIEDAAGNKRIVKLEPYGRGASYINPTGSPGTDDSVPMAGGQVPGFGGGLSAAFNTKAGRTEFSKKAADLVIKQPEAQSSLSNAHNNLDRLKAVATEIRNSPALTRITGLIGVVPSFPGGHAADLDAQLETLKSQIGFAALQAMRDASKTGGALGQVSDRENTLLQNNLAALNTKQSPAQFKKSMDAVISYVDAAKKRLSDAYDLTYSNRPNPAQRPAQGGVITKEQYDALPRGSKYISPDGKERIKQ